MATMSTTDLLDVFKNMTVLELNDFLKAFEEEFGVTAAAPVAVAAAPGARRRRRRRRSRRGEGRVRRHPHGRRRQEDPGDQGRARAHQPGPERGQGPRRRRAEAGRREGVEGRRREGQGEARGVGRLGRAQVASAASAGVRVGKICRESRCHPTGSGLSCTEHPGSGRASGRCPFRGDWQPAWLLAMLGCTRVCPLVLSDLPGPCRRAPDCPGCLASTPFVAHPAARLAIQHFRSLILSGLE